MAELIDQGRVDNLFERRGRDLRAIDNNDQNLSDKDRAELLAALSDRKAFRFGQAIVKASDLQPKE